MEPTKIIIEPTSNLRLGFKEIWEHRELFYFFTWRDIKVKYKQTSLGIIWAVLQPLALMILFTFVFSKNLNFDTGKIRYEIFVLSGLILWGLFHSSVSHSAESVIQQSNIIKKIYFPRLIIPASSLLVALFDFIIALVLFFIFCVFMGQPLKLVAFIYIPISVLIVVLSAFGLGTLLSALTIRFRDFRYTLPFFLQFLFFATCVIYSLDSLEPTWLKYLLAFNPVNGAIELFRGSLQSGVDLTVILIGFFTSIFLSLIGLIYFRKTESFFADLS